MSRAARSLLVFGCYMIGIGVALLFAPNLLLGLVGLPPTGEVWIRVVAMLVLFLGCFDIGAALQELTPFIRLSIPIRASVIIFFAAFVVLGMAGPSLLLFGCIDLAGALWTAAALRADQHSHA